MRILIVDDDEVLCLVVENILKSKGFESHCAHSGKSALEFVKNHEIDGIISDIRMPDGDGYFLLQSLKEIHFNKPILIMSGYTDYSEEELLNLGACAFMEKPVTPQIFLNNLEKYLRAS